RELCNLVIRSIASSSIQHANAALRKITDKLFQDRNCGVILAADAEQQFVVGIVLAAKAGEVLVCVRIDPAKRFQIADRRQVTAFRGLRCSKKKATGNIEGNEVINKRKSRNYEQSVVEKSRHRRISA